MKRILLASAALALLWASTPLTAKHRSSGVCRIDHPAYYYQSQGYRPHHRYGSRHFFGYHNGRGRFRGADRYYRGNPFYRGGSRFYRGGSRFYRGGRGYYRSHRPRPSFHRRRYHRRPRIGIYVEF